MEEAWGAPASREVSGEAQAGMGQGFGETCL